MALLVYCMVGKPSYQQQRAKTWQDFSEKINSHMLLCTTVRQAVPHSLQSIATKLEEKLYDAVCWNVPENTHGLVGYSDCPNRHNSNHEVLPTSDILEYLKVQM